MSEQDKSSIRVQQRLSSRIFRAIRQSAFANAIRDHIAIGNCAHRFVLLARIQMNAAVRAPVESNGIDSMMTNLELIDDIHHRVRLRRITRRRARYG
ncbi:hypothetical protein WT63_25095 [Burkholderia anthina]|nr:hypothetical protein WT63_25095 [Burkholderia anthina]